MKAFYPTEEEFLEPIIYIEKLFKEGASKYGCVKIIPPSSFKPPYSFNKCSKQKLPFRSQTVQNLSRGKVKIFGLNWIQEFIYNKEGTTYKEFREKATILEEKYLEDISNLPYKEKILKIQQDYWNLVDNHTSDKFEEFDKIGEAIKIEDGEKVFRFNYAADLPVNKFGSGFPTEEQDKDYGRHPFNFMNLNDQERSLLAF